MRKRFFIYWGAILLTALLIGGGAMLLGRAGGPRLAAFLPEPSREDPYLLVERIPGPAEGGNGSMLVSSLLASFLGDESRQAFLKVTSEVPAVLLVSFGGERPGFWGSASISGKTLDGLSSGKLPEGWIEAFPGAVLTGEKERTWRLDNPGGESLWLRVEGSVLLVADRAEELDRMQAAGGGRLESVQAAWRVKPGWAGHLRLSDAGEPGRVPLLDLVSSPGGDDSPVTVEVGWRSVPPFGGEAAWVSDGMAGRIFPKVGTLAGPIPWNGKLVFPEPLALAMGINWPAPVPPEKEVSADEPGAGEDHTGFWGAWAGLSEERLRRFLQGPLVFSMGGKARAMGLATPGFLVEFPGRKEEGTQFVRSLLGDRWGLSGLLGRDVKGFEVGGSIPLPFTVMAAANMETALLGYLEPESLGSGKLPGELSGDFKEPAFAWLWMDGEILSGVLETLGPGSPGFRILGLEEKSRELGLILGLAQGAGKLSALMPTVESGKVTWSGVEQGNAQP